MKLTISESKNAESYYIAQSYKTKNGKSTTKIVRKLGTLAELSQKLDTDRDGVLKWAKDRVRLETENYNAEKEARKILVPFDTAKELEHDKQVIVNDIYFYTLSNSYRLERGHTT